MNNKKTESKPRWCDELAHYFSTEGSTPECVIYNLRHASMTIARNCAHPQDIEAEDLETIACALDFLSEIMDIVDKYETT